MYDCKIAMYVVSMGDRRKNTELVDQDMSNKMVLFLDPRFQLLSVSKAVVTRNVLSLI